MMISILGSLLAGLGFGVIFNIHGKNLIAAAIGGTIGFVCYELLLSYNVSTSAALFFAAMVFSTYSEICARKLQAPVTTFLVIALIILVPGKGMYYTMLEVIQGNTNQAILTGIETIANAGALALGTIFISTFAKFIFSKKR